MKVIDENTQKMLDSLTKIVAETLDRKQRLGEYAVIWKEGKPIKTIEEITPGKLSNKA